MKTLRSRSAADHVPNSVGSLEDPHDLGLSWQPFEREVADVNPVRAA
jgi:hypothetical protein